MPTQMQRPAPIRKPRAHERVWRDRCVDKNLDDAWLESLNALTAFKLISICEGHQTPPRSSEPHINLRIYADRTGQAVSNWNALQSGIDEFLISYANQLQDTRVEAELRRRSRALPRHGHSRADDFVVRLSRTPTAGELRQPIVGWFDRMVLLVQSLDRVVVEQTLWPTPVQQVQ